MRRRLAGKADREDNKHDPGCPGRHLPHAPRYIVRIHMPLFHIAGMHVPPRVLGVPWEFLSHLRLWMAGGQGTEVLSQGVGYGIVVGIGAFFALLMYVPSYLYRAGYLS